MLYPVILSGGFGKRLWPVSSQSHPKQFQKLFNNKTLLQNTYNRILRGFSKENIFVATNINLIDYVKSQININEDNIIIEPEVKGTAIAIALAAVKILSLDPEANLVIVNSDHFIKNEDAYINLLRQAEKYLDGQYADRFILAGVKPIYPETGYGYIKLGKKIVDNLFMVDSFKEKPDYKTAQQYIKEGFLWNPAIFLFKAAKLLDWYKKYLPVLYKVLMNISDDFSIANLKIEYAKINIESIDCGLLEKMNNMIIIPSDIIWADIGHWRSLRDILAKQLGDNVSNTKFAGIDSKNNLLYSSNNKKLITTIGVEDMILVETEQVILLCPANRSQDIKKLLSELKKQGLEKYL